MLYLLLIIIIGLLVKLIYFPRDKGAEAQAHWNNLFGRKIHIPDYRKDDPRNETHPEEMVRMRDGSLSHRKLATMLEAIQGKIPTYEEMLKMDEKEFKQWLLIRNETDREKLLAEMIDQEDSTGSFRMTAKEDISGAEQAILDVFDIDKSARIVRTFGKVKNALTEGEKEGVDLVETAIFAKAASDHVGPKAKMEKVG